MRISSERDVYLLCLFCFFVCVQCAYVFDKRHLHSLNDSNVVACHFQLNPLNNAFAIWSIFCCRNPKYTQIHSQCNHYTNTHTHTQQRQTHEHTYTHIDVLNSFWHFEYFVIVNRWCHLLVKSLWFPNKPSIKESNLLFTWLFKFHNFQKTASLLIRIP